MDAISGRKKLTPPLRTASLLLPRMVDELLGLSLTDGAEARGFWKNFANEGFTACLMC